MKSALIFYGGWNGHTPKKAAELTAKELERENYKVTLSDSLECLEKLAKLKKFDVIIPVWTMGSLSPDQAKNLCAAVKSGVGLAGFHGGMGDAFRGCTEYEWMIGGHFVGHPYVGEYTVRLADVKSPVTKGMKKSFKYNSEQYYMLCDPGIKVLASTRYRHEDGNAEMPVVWTKRWGKGKVFYSALGHTAEELECNSEILAMTIRGIKWASKKKIMETGK
jgi:type 1 glutamine amidotransferase